MRPPKNWNTDTHTPLDNRIRLPRRKRTTLPQGFRQNAMLLATTENLFTTEVWLTPLILLPGVALLIGSTSVRFQQLHAEFHRLVEHPNAHVRILSRSLVRRSKLYRDALASLYVSVAVLSLGSLVGAFVHLFWPTSLWLVGGFTVVGIGCLVFASMQLVRESLICLDVIREQHSLLRRETDDT